MWKLYVNKKDLAPAYLQATFKAFSVKIAITRINYANPKTTKPLA